MAFSLAPDYLFRHFYDITPDFLKSEGIDFILSDIDNTLAPYEMLLPDETISGWIRDLEENGIKIALISNNDADRVEHFNEPLGLCAYSESKKPFKPTLEKAISEIGGEVSRCAVLGDQLLTDVLAARLLGARAILVPPIKDKTSAFFKLKRWLERPTMKRYIKKHGFIGSSDGNEEKTVW